ncbi:hypothetical protein O3P69_006323 [Scylla paramamosain]|uniref:Uncharacterized protein n=1 Tax=Scylla paramamosain TaxID=85552 RepID=A0AAW0U1V7_SCYPA
MADPQDWSEQYLRDKSEDTLLKSLDRLELKYEVALQEWQQISKVIQEKDDPQPLGRSKHLPKRLPKLATLSDINGSLPGEPAIRMKLVKVVSQCRMQEMQVRNEVQGQVEALCSRVTELEEKKTEALERMRSLLAEETMTSQNMKAAVTEVCTEQKEHAVEMDEKYHILWSNVEQLLGCCDKFLELTRPEVEALKLDAHQANESDRIQTFVSHSQERFEAPKRVSADVKSGVRLIRLSFGLCSSSSSDILQTASEAACG